MIYTAEHFFDCIIVRASKDPDFYLVFCRHGYRDRPAALDEWMAQATESGAEIHEYMAD